MFDGSRVAVIVPAYNEEQLIAKTLSTVPDFVDWVFVIDDASADATAETARALGQSRVRVIRHDVNRGVGAAIVTGYRAALDAGADVLAVMAGDAQMDPDDLASLVRPVARGAADYAKGDRFCHPDVRRIMPTGRLFAGRLLSWLTARAAGLPALSDSQCGYTAISAEALGAIDLDDVWPRYGYPNDLIGHLSMAGLRLVDVPVRPVYGAEKSGIRPWHVIAIVVLIVRTAYRRRREIRGTVTAA